MKRLVVAPHSRRVEHVLRAVGLDEESMALVFTHGPSVDSVGPKNTVLVDSSDVVRAVSVAVSYAKSFERVRVVASESSSPNPVVASTLAFVALSSIEPYSGFVLEPFTLYHTGKTKELSGRLRLWVRGSRDYEILKAFDPGLPRCCVGIRAIFYT